MACAVISRGEFGGAPPWETCSTCLAYAGMLRCGPADGRQHNCASCPCEEARPKQRPFWTCGLGPRALAGYTAQALAVGGLCAHALAYWMARGVAGVRPGESWCSDTCASCLAFHEGVPVGRWSPRRESLHRQARAWSPSVGVLPAWTSAEMALPPRYGPERDVETTPRSASVEVARREGFSSGPFPLEVDRGVASGTRRSPAGGRRR